MSNQLDQDIHDLLTSIYQSDTTEPHDGSHPRRTLNIYIDVEEEAVGQPPTIDSTLYEQPTTTTTSEAYRPVVATEQPSPQSDSIESSRTKRQQRKCFAMLLFLLFPVLGILAGVIYTISMPFLTPSADITIVIQSQRITTTSILQVVTNGVADPTKKQIPGRILPAITMSQQKTILTTGTARQDAKEAHGFITFYNAAPYVQIVQARTMITGADGIQILTDQDATIPAAVMPTEGQVTIGGHAAIKGSQGNIKVGDIYGPCCRLNVFVANGAFHGGQNARSYQSVTPQDITTVVRSFKKSLVQSVQAALQTQIQVSETLVAPLFCTSNVTSDHQAGEEATRVSIVVSESCTGIVYTTRVLMTLATQLAIQDAITRLGTEYTITGVQTSIIQVILKDHGSSDLQVKSVSLWAYSLGLEQQQAIKSTIAGMNRNKATATLLHLTGVQSVAISLKSGTDLPADAQYIHLLFLQG